MVVRVFSLSLHTAQIPTKPDVRLLFYFQDEFCCCVTVEDGGQAVSGPQTGLCKSARTFLKQQVKRDAISITAAYQKTLSVPLFICLHTFSS